MTIHNTTLVGGIILALCLMAVGFTGEHTGGINWTAGDGVKHYGAGHER